MGNAVSESGEDPCPGGGAGYEASEVAVQGLVTIRDSAVRVRDHRTGTTAVYRPVELEVPSLRRPLDACRIGRPPGLVLSPLRGIIDASGVTAAREDGAGRRCHIELDGLVVRRGGKALLELRPGLQPGARRLGTHRVRPHVEGAADSRSASRRSRRGGGCDDATASAMRPSSSAGRRGSQTPRDTSRSQAASASSADHPPEASASSGASRSRAAASASSRPWRGYVMTTSNSQRPSYWAQRTGCAANVVDVVVTTTAPGIAKPITTRPGTLPGGQHLRAATSAPPAPPL
jgi:hypothetical protein